jgi:serine/threonine-protein kinase
VPADGGIRFGQYVLVRRIARGGMAEVFLAQQRGLEGFDRRVAVKRILPHLADSADFLKMFMSEARLAAQLTHPNIVHIYEFGKVDHDYFIAMEFVDGVHAGQVFRHGTDKDRISPTLVARIGADAAAALHYAHQLPGPSGKPLALVHRDVSPANIMISYDGTVKLCDFGIAKAAALTDQLTNPGQVKGKYAYMSPEQTVAKPLDGRSDVFALSIVLWELVTGKFIVQRGDAVDAMRAIRDGKLEPIASAAPGVPEALANAITWGLQTKREQRATAAELAQALEAFIKSSPEIATPMQLGGWIRQRFVREGTGESRAFVQPTGTQPAQGTLAAPSTAAAAPGTLAAPGTVGGTLAPVTPPQLIGASRVAGALDDTSETIAVGPPSSMSGPDGGETIVDDPQKRGGADSTARPPDATEVVAAVEPRPAARKTQPPPPVRARTPSSAPRAASTPIPGARRTTTPASGSRRRVTPLPIDVTARRRKRIAITIVIFSGVAAVSFLIALAASGSRTSAPATVADARPHVAVDAAAIDARAVDAATAAVDAPPTASTLLEISTTPPGAMLHVGTQSRVAPASLALPDGHYEVTAELAGYDDETRTVDLLHGEHRIMEIVFAHKKRVPSGPPMGQLTVRTDPYSEVFEGGKKLGETPFAGKELAAGVHVLVFKHPSHAAVKKTVKIVAGKETKLGFALP